MDAIVTRGLSKAFKEIGKPKVHSLESLDITIREHEVFGFLGRNGAGKTTTIKILCSLLKPTAGEAFAFGENVRTRRARRLIGYLPEQPYFYEYLTPKETLDFYGQLQGFGQAERAREWDKLSEMLDLRDIAMQRIKGFSKGMRQRVGFAVALVGDPPLLVLDEPMSGLDPIGRRRIRELILRMRDEKKTLFFSSHVLADVEQVCDRVGILVKGRLVRQGRIDELVGGKAAGVEVVATGLDAGAVAAIKATSATHRTLDELERFCFPDTEGGNRAAKMVLEHGGRIVEFSPLRETLEEYFMRNQEPGERVEGVS